MNHLVEEDGHTADQDPIQMVVKDVHFLVGRAQEKV